MGKYVFFAAISSASALFSLEEKPWLGDVYSFGMQTECAYSRFRYIDHALVQPDYAYNNYLTNVGFSLTTQYDVELGVELEMARTPHELYGFRSSALGARYRLLDDIAGDFLSLVLGTEVRAVSGRAVRDVSSPYATYMNYEIFSSLGKEFTKDGDWKSRGYLLGSLGIGNKGAPWNRFEGVLEGRFRKSQVVSLFGLAYLGYGLHKTVNISDFHGWGNIQHRSLDLGLSYRYIFSLWGEVALSYAYRVVAVSYPQNTQTVELRYFLPFSLF